MATIYVGNVDRRYTEANIRSVFEVYGPVANVNVVSDFAVVNMVDNQQAQKAVSDLNDARSSWCVRTMPHGA